MFKTIRLLVTGAAIGCAVDRVWLELHKPAAEQFPWLRKSVNDTVNPWLIGHGIPGSAHGEIATLEHVGRKSGTTFYTPIHPTVRETLRADPGAAGR